MLAIVRKQLKSHPAVSSIRAKFGKCKEKTQNSCAKMLAVALARPNFDLTCPQNEIKVQILRGFPG